MHTHPLITYATRQRYKQIPEMPNGSTYDRVSGYWLYRENPLVEDADFDKIVSKKCDQETGEDQKGE